MISWLVGITIWLIVGLIHSYLNDAWSETLWLVLASALIGGIWILLFLCLWFLLWREVENSKKWKRQNLEKYKKQEKTEKIK